MDQHYWEENGHALKYEKYPRGDVYESTEEDQQALSAPVTDDGFPPAFRLKGKQDPMSHRIIEKRRRDRMNNCLADLSRLIPSEYLKKGRGRVEKTEIIEMAIRRLKYLQDATSGSIVAGAGGQNGAKSFRAGFREAVAEAVRYLEVQGYAPEGGICTQLAAHLHRHFEHITKGSAYARDKCRSHNGSSSETAGSSSSSCATSFKTAACRPDSARLETFDRPQDPVYMDCDKIPNEEVNGDSSALRAVRKPEAADDFHTYKFKNSIERRFTKAQDCEATDMSLRANDKVHSSKRRRFVKQAPSTTTSTSNSGSNEDARDTSPQDTSSESPHNHYEKPPAPAVQYVPVFALNTIGKYYVPLSVEYDCVARQAGACGALDARAAHYPAPLHPVTIHVNFQPCLDFHVKREGGDHWQTV